MQVSPRMRVMVVPTVALALLLSIAPAATRAEPPAPDAPPQVTPIPPAYPPPPPRYPGEPPIDYPFPPGATAAGMGPPPAPAAGPGVYRMLSLGGALGPGALFGPGESDLAVAYELVAGLGVATDFALQIGFGSVGTGSVNPATGKDSWLKQDLWSLGLRYHFGPRGYLRGGVGLGFVSEKTSSATFSGGHGFGALGAVGYEMIQRKHVALAIELEGSATHYPRESWQTAGLHLAVSLF